MHVYVDEDWIKTKKRHLSASPLDLLDFIEKRRAVGQTSTPKHWSPELVRGRHYSVSLQTRRPPTSWGVRPEMHFPTKSF